LLAKGQQLLTLMLRWIGSATTYPLRSCHGDSPAAVLHTLQQAVLASRCVQQVYPTRIQAIMMHQTQLHTHLGISASL
jgi:hypothetical protein